MRSQLAALAIVTVLLPACAGEDSTTVDEPLTADMSSIQANVFTPSCASASACHDDSASAGDLDLTAGHSHANLVGMPSVIAPTRTLVMPGDPDQSFLVAKLRGDIDEEIEGSRMPFGQLPLDAEAVDAIADWVAAGATDD